MAISKAFVINQPEIGDLVRDLRRVLGLSQEKFATKLGVTFATINRWENNRATPSPIALKLIENLLKELDSSPDKRLQAQRKMFLHKHFSS
jgi:putative transcriptional regulator